MPGLYNYGLNEYGEISVLFFVLLAVVLFSQITSNNKAAGWSFLIGIFLAYPF